PVPAPEAAHAARPEDAEAHVRAMGDDRFEDHVEHPRVLGTHAPRSHPVGRVVVPAQVLHDLVEATVDQQAVLVRPGAGGPLAADVDADPPAVLHAGGDPPVPERAIRPDAAAEILDGVTRLRLHGVARPADTNGTFAWERVVL